MTLEWLDVTNMEDIWADGWDTNRNQTQPNIRNLCTPNSSLSMDFAVCTYTHTLNLLCLTQTKLTTTINHTGRLILPLLPFALMNFLLKTFIFAMQIIYGKCMKIRNVGNKKKAFTWNHTIQTQLLLPFYPMYSSHADECINRSM